MPTPSLRPLIDRFDGGAAAVPWSGQADAALVFIPAALTRAEDFVEHGFLAAVRARGLPVDLLRIELPLDGYAAGTLAAQLDDLVDELADASRSTALWLVGISLGAMAALACAQRDAARAGHHGKRCITGVCALAPWPGPRAVWQPMVAAGSPARWPTAIGAAGTEFADEFAVWRALAAGFGAAARPPAGAFAAMPRIILGCGRTDRYADAHRAMAAALPLDDVIEADGSHDWPTWRELWTRCLPRLLPDASAPPSVDGARASSHR